MEMKHTRWPKRLIAAFIAFAMIFGAIGFNNVQAEASTVPRVRVAGHYVQFEGTQPIHLNGVIHVPVRGVFTLMGFEPTWHGAANTASLYDGQTRIVIPIGLPTFTVNGRVVTPEVPQKNVGGRVMIPLRAVTEAIGGTAHWDGVNRVAVISPPPELLDRVLANIGALAAPTISTTSLTGGNVGQFYNQTLTATASSTWAVTVGVLPPGLSLNITTGAITGTPTTNGTFNFTVMAQNASGFYTRAFSIVIGGGQHTVTFNANGGTGTMAAQTFNPGVAQNLRANTFTRTGYSFAGWRTGPTGTAVQYTDGQNITVTANRTMYAVWVRGYTVTFNANGGTGTMASQVFQRNTAQDLRANTFTRSGHSFVGWRTSPSGTAVQYADGQRVTINANRTLYAVWVQGYTVTFNANGGTGTMLPQGFQRNVGQNLRTNTFTRAGYTFAGWRTAATGTTVERVDGEWITVNHNHTLFAVWTPGNAPVISPMPWPIAATNGQHYSHQFTATGAAPITWSHVGGTLPTGLTLSSGGLLSGTPNVTTTPQTFNFRVRAANAAGSNEHDFTITVHGGTAPNITTTVLSPATATVGVQYNTAAKAATGALPITWSIVGGNNHNWLQINPSTGALTGTPQAGTVGAGSVVVRATNSVGHHDRTFTFTVQAAVLASPTITGNNTVTFTEGVLETFVWSAAPGDITWNVTSSNLPPGVTFNNGQLSGTPGPVTAGSFSITITATNSGGTSAPYIITVVVLPPTP
ncbi:MAG: InlB B-repeat-containing protein [Defluviitaleaceae bacterium]|nr:InlB B-repeat-containing protein [Defluviitaleaceae bacterium]